MSPSVSALVATLVATRRDAGLTQRQLAKRLGRVHSFVGKIEKGRRQLTVGEFCEVATALGVDPRELLTKILKLIGEGGTSGRPNPD